MSNHLTLEERAIIRAKIDCGCTVREISRTVQRAASTIQRELRRNGCDYRAASAVKPERAKRGRPRKGYDLAAAHKRARTKAAKPRVARKLRIGNPSCLLWQALYALLKAKHSPQCACGILKQMYPHSPELHLVHESFYSAFYLMPKGELRSEIVALLRRERAHRKPHGVGQSRRGRIIDLVPISERPSEVAERVIPGHWEGDLIKGSFGRSAIGSAVERTTLFTVLAKMPSACSLDCVQAFAAVLNRIDAQKRLSFTYDRGKEMAAHARLTELTTMKVYFADPHSPWQRGINENTNGLLRQYFPKKTDLSVYSQDALDAVAWQLNTRPRKSLGWRCPAQLMFPEFDFKAHFLHTFGDLTKLQPHYPRCVWSWNVPRIFGEISPGKCCFYAAGFYGRSRLNSAHASDYCSTRPHGPSARPASLRARAGLLCRAGRSGVARPKRVEQTRLFFSTGCRAARYVSRDVAGAPRCGDAAACGLWHYTAIA